MAAQTDIRVGNYVQLKPRTMRVDRIEGAQNDLIFVVYDEDGIMKQAEYHYNDLIKVSNPNIRR